MKILITGAGGMLGTDLAGRLSAKHQVKGVGIRPVTHLTIPYQIANLANRQLVEKLIEVEKPEIILHAAAMTDVDGCEGNRREALAANLEATRFIAESARRIGSLVIFFSTDFVFDGEKEGPYREKDPPHPISVYGESKHLAERYLLIRGRRFMILRTSWLFGKQGNNFPKKILKQAEAGKPLRVVSDQFGSPTYTGDLAEAVERIIDILPERGKAGENQIFHVANQGVVSRYEFAKTILKKRNFPLELLTPVSSDALSAPARRPKNSALTTDKLESYFGIKLRRWEAALEAYLNEETKEPSPST